mgnify:CR=1 FL=1
MDETKHKASLTEGPIGRTLFRLSVPMFLGIFSAIAFNIVDTFFVGKLGTQQLAAMSFTFPVVSLIGSLSLGLGAGASAIISRAIGRGDHQEVQRLTSDSLVLSLLIVVFFVIIGLLTMDGVFYLLGAGPNILDMVKDYMRIWYLGMAFIIIPMVGNNALRATGDTKTPMLIMLVSFIINFILDPLLIFGLGPFPRLEIEGAALATVIARAVTMVVSIWILYKREDMLTFKHPPIRTVIHSWGRLLYIGIPSAATNMVRPLGMGIITKMVAVYGPAAVAGYGVATRIDAFALIVIMALASVLNPFIGQNSGRGNFFRVEKAIHLSQRFSLLWGGGMFLFFLLFAGMVAVPFSENTEVLGTITMYLYIVPIGYGLFGIYAMANSAFNVLNKPFYASAITLIQIFIFTIPMALLGSHLAGLMGIFIGIMISNLLSGFMALAWLKRYLKKLTNPLTEPTPIL